MITRKLGWSVAVLSGFVWFGCGSGGSSLGNIPTTKTASVVLPNHLTFSLSENTAFVPLGNQVTYVESVTNNTSAPITATLAVYGSNTPPAPYAFVAVQDSTGARISANGGLYTPLPLAAPQPLTLTLQPAQSISHVETYTFVKSDTFTANVALLNPDASVAGTAGPISLIVQ